MSEITRPLTVRFNTRHFSRLVHDEVMSSIEEVADLAEVKAIQITENNCLITVVSNEVKEQLIIDGINIRNTYNNVYDVDRVLTNVTIKDAPYELNDIFLIEHLRKFGEVVENSLRRGKIRGTEIETGTRYVQLVNCKEAIPIQTSFGRFRVRIFSDNKTECRVCGETGHPLFKCPEKETDRKCTRCKSSSHLTRDCTNDIVCHFCNGEGHKKSECEEFKRANERKLLGRYADEIFEGREAKKDDDEHDTVRKQIDFETTDNDYTNTDSANLDTHNDTTHVNTESITDADIEHLDDDKDDTRSKQLQGAGPLNLKSVEQAEFTGDQVNIVFGDSNATRVHFKDPSVLNFSQSGTAAAGITSLFSKAKPKTANRRVKRVAIHLGTIDIGRNRSDANQVILEVSSAITDTHRQYPDADIAFSSIPHRKGKTPAINTMNATVKSVNEYVCKLTKKESYLYYLNNDDDLLDKGVPIRSMYDSSDANGVHLSSKGAEVLEENIQTFFDSGLTPDMAFETPLSKKRNRSVLSNTPPSDKHVSKQNKP